MTDYEILIHHGHAPAKAAEIVLDATRGDAFSVQWIAVIRRRVEAQGVGKRED